MATTVAEKKKNVARRTRNKRERLTEYSQRFDHVQIENLDFERLFERYDSQQTVFYCDPPYVEEGDALYSGAEFEHGRFIRCLSNLEGRWLVSYTDIPDRLREMAAVIKSREKPQRISGNKGTRTERLVMNFDPDSVAKFCGQGQHSLDDW